MGRSVKGMDGLVRGVVSERALTSERGEVSERKGQRSERIF